MNTIQLTTCDFAGRFGDKRLEKRGFWCVVPLKKPLPSAFEGRTPIRLQQRQLIGS